jgi:hypothetical protein
MTGDTMIIYVTKHLAFPEKYENLFSGKLQSTNCEIPVKRSIYQFKNIYTLTSRHTIRRGIWASTSLCPWLQFIFSVSRPHKLSAPVNNK